MAAAPILLVMPAYNRERYVAAAIKSVLAQTRGDFDLVVYDDGSTDGTLAAARGAAGDDPRVRVLSGENLGFPRTINRAAAEAPGGQYFGWVDSDDLLAPTALAETTAVLDANPAVGMIYTSYVAIDAAGNTRGPGKRCQIPYSPQRLLVDFMTFHFRLMRRELFDRLGGVDPTYATTPDYDLCLKLSEITEIRHVDRPLYAYRVHGAAMSQVDRLRLIQESRDAIRAALKRRGLEGKVELKLEVQAKFSLVEKRAASGAAGAVTRDSSAPA